MISSNSETKLNRSVSQGLSLTTIDLWSGVYIFMVVGLSILQVRFDTILFMVYFLFAMPFVKHIERYIAITLMFSTIAYYFVGANAGILSMPTILVVLIAFRVLFGNKGILKFDKANIFSILGLAVIATFSFSVSQFGYVNGWLGLLFVLLTTTIVGNFVEIDLEKLVRSIYFVSYLLVIGYVFTLLSSGLFVDGRLTIAEGVNTNSFGKSCALLATVFLVGSFIYKEHRFRNIVFCFCVAAISFLTGSRGSLIAFLMASILTLVVYAYRRGMLTGTMLKIVVFCVTALFVFGLSMTLFDVDISRFELSSLLGSRRRMIYESVFPYIIREKYWVLGYGPGHDCSRQVIRSLIGWDFTHTHNTFLEAFGELGVFGLLFTVICTTTSIKNIHKVSNERTEGYVLLAFLVCLLVNSLAESFFCNYIFWCTLAICRQKHILNACRENHSLQFGEAK